MLNIYKISNITYYNFKIEWYQNDLQIQPNEHRTFSYKENKYSLVLEVCDLNDSGEYKAVLKNKFGQAQSKCRLNVYPNNENFKNSPNFVELLKDINIQKGQDVCFKCVVVGTPQPEVKWFKDGHPIKETNNIKVGSLNKYLN